MTIEELYKKYSAHILLLCKRYIYNNADAEDIVQTVFLKAWRSLGSFKNQAHHFTWLYRIGVNECLNYLRKHRHEQVPFDEAKYTGSAEDSLSPGEKNLFWNMIMSNLDTKEREIIFLYAFERLRMSEIAVVMQTSRQALHKRWEKLRNKIQKRIRS